MKRLLGNFGPAPLLLAVAAVLGCSGGGSSSPASNAPASNLPTQGWTLTNDAGQVAYVLVQPFTYSGAFKEASSSPGWWLLDGTGNKVVQIPVSGMISHAGSYDTWDFTITVQGGGMRLTGTGTGTSDAPYPNGRNVIGTISGTATSPMGSQVTHDTWSGNDYTVWKTGTAPRLMVPAYVGAGASGLAASVLARPGASYAWTIVGGSILEGSGTHQITFTAGSSGTVRLACVITPPDGGETTTAEATSTITQ